MAKGCILVVDDEPMIERAYEELLESSGYERISYNDAQEAFYFLMVNHSKIDVALIDLTMPNVKGSEIARQMSFIDPELPIILMTGNLETDYEDANVRTVLKKPITKAELLAAVERHMRQSPHESCEAISTDRDQTKSSSV